MAGLPFGGATEDEDLETAEALEDEASAEDEYSSDEDAALADAFPDPEQRAAILSAIQICVDKAAMSGSEPPPAKPKGEDALALLIAAGGPPKAKKKPIGKTPAEGYDV